MEKQRIHFTSIDSTNVWAKEHLGEVDPRALTLVTAGSQTSGRGRRGRGWVSPAGENLIATFVWFDENPLAYASNVGQVLALAVCDALPKVPFELKWPNDLLLRGKKCGGILCESSGGALIAGVGINVNCEQLPVMDQPVTSIRIETGTGYGIDELATRLHGTFAEALAELQAKGFAVFLDRYKALLASAGRHGVIHDVLPDGAIVLETEQGLRTYRDAP